MGLWDFKAAILSRQSDHWWRWGSQPKSESETLYDWRFTTNQFVLATNPLRLSSSNLFQLNTCDRSPYVTSSLTRGWVCRLQLLLVLASADVLWDSWPCFTVSDSRLTQTGGPRPHIYIPQGQGGLVIPLGTGFPFYRFLRLAGLRWRCLPYAPAAPNPKQDS
jgi:hypothetical protein